MAKLPTNQHITYQLQFRKCGKPSCGTCKRGPGHGPYWYAYWREGNKLRSGDIGKARPSAVPPAVVARAEARLDLRRAQHHSDGRADNRLDNRPELARVGA
jgi:hypothetical protein